MHSPRSWQAGFNCARHLTLLLCVVEPVAQWFFVVDGLDNNLVIVEQVFFLLHRRDLFKT